METKNFSTRTEWRRKDNPHMDGVHIIGLDMGYSGPKGFPEKGNFVFPNFCMKLETELFQEPGKNDMIYKDADTGERYCVGDMAGRLLTEDSVVQEDAYYDRNHYLHPHFLVQFRAALALAMWDTPTDGHDIFIQTGLPPVYMERDQSIIKSVMAGEHHFFLTVGTQTKEFDITIKETQVDVIYQPMGTYWSTVFDVNGNITNDIFEFRTSNFMVLDGGFKTLDKFIVKGNTIQKGTDPNLGMHRILDETRRLMGTQTSIPAMQSCLKTGQIQINDVANFQIKMVPIGKYLEQANARVREEAFESVKNEFFSIRYLIMTGGTGAAWYDYFKERLNGFPVKVVPGNLNSPLPYIYSNARGYYMYRLQQMKAKR